MERLFKSLHDFLNSLNLLFIKSLFESVKIVLLGC
nr:MAG TPA: hypothetical protein [Caudoviricetes sp.]